MFEQKFMDADTFLSEAAASGPTFTWLIKNDPGRPDYILYTPHIALPPRCPTAPLHKSRIYRIEPLGQVPCYNNSSSGPSNGGYAWIARVTLVTLTQSKDIELMGALAALSEMTATDKSLGNTCESCSTQKSSTEGVAASRWCLNVEGGREPGVHYYASYNAAYNSRAYFFSSAVGAHSVTGPYQC